MLSFGTALRPQPRCYLKAFPVPCSLTTAPYSVACTAYTACMLQRGLRYGGWLLRLASHIKTVPTGCDCSSRPSFICSIARPSSTLRPKIPSPIASFPLGACAPRPRAYLYITRQPWSVSIIRAPRTASREPETATSDQTLPDSPHLMECLPHRWRVPFLISHPVTSASGLTPSRHRRRLVSLDQTATPVIRQSTPPSKPLLDCPSLVSLHTTSCASCSLKAPLAQDASRSGNSIQPCVRFRPATDVNFVCLSASDAPHPKSVPRARRPACLVFVVCSPQTKPRLRILHQSLRCLGLGVT